MNQGIEMKTFRSWEITSWPEVLWKAPASRSRWPVFHHMGTDIRADSDADGRAIGDTVWAARVNSDQIVGLAWEWIEVKPGAPAIRDPNGFVSNVRFLGPYGADLDELQALVRLNRIAHVTPWQSVVGRAVRAGGSWLDQRVGLRPLPGAQRRADAGELALLRDLVANLPFQPAPRLGRAAA